MICKVVDLYGEDNRTGEEDHGTRAPLARGQVTLPAELRQKLQVKEGDYLEAEVVENGMLLKPVAFVSREQAWKAIREAQQSVRYIGPEPRPGPKDEEEQIYEIVCMTKEEIAQFPALLSHAPSVRRGAPRQWR